jgi:hypothetical protein
MHSNLEDPAKPFMNTWALIVEFVDHELLPQGTVGSDVLALALGQKPGQARKSQGQARPEGMA